MKRKREHPTPYQVVKKQTEIIRKALRNKGYLIVHEGTDENIERRFTISIKNLTREQVKDIDI